MRHTKTYRKNSGFTIIELLVVMGIMIVLAAMTIPTLGRLRNRARESRTKSLINKLEIAMAMYESFWGFYPPASSNADNINDGRLDDMLCKHVTATESFGRGTSKAFYEPHSDDYVLSAGKKVFVDGWSNPLIVYSSNLPYNISGIDPLVHNPDTCVIYSYGVDGTNDVTGADSDGDGELDEIEDIDDDITNWAT